MPNELPNLGADIVLEFQQSINNIRLFKEALDGLDARFGSLENRINSMRSTMNSLSEHVSGGGGRNLRAELERQLNDFLMSKGIVVSKIGNSPLKVDGNTVRSVFNRVEVEINKKLAEAYKNIVIQVDPSLQVGKVPIDRDDFAEVNKAIAKLVRVQLNNLVAALQKHGAGLISAQDLSTIQLQIGKSTVQQIINKVKSHLNEILLNPVIGSDARLEFSNRDLDRVFKAIRDRVRESIQNTVEQVSVHRDASNFADNIRRMHSAIDESASDYIRSVTQGINSISATDMARPLNQLSTQLRRFMAKELGTDLDTFNRMFAQQQFTNADVMSAEFRRQFARLEQALNRKIGGGLTDEVKEIIKQIDSVQISYSPKLRYHLVQEINRINNQIVKKIREQIDLQFANMRAEIDSVRVAPKDINRARRIRSLGQVETEAASVERRTRQEPLTLANDPYARRDAYFNSFGLEGAIVNTIRHILAGSLVGAPMMMAYQAIETFKTSQLEQLKMYSNLYSKAQSESQEMAARGDMRTPAEYASQTVKEIIPFVRDASVHHAIDYGTMSQVASVGSRLLDTATEVKAFTDVVGKIYNIDREGDPAETIAPGLEAFMGQFDMVVGEMERRVALPLDVATNLTNATTEAVLNAIARSGSMFKAAGVSPEDAIALVATSIKHTGLTGENIGNFYKSILPRLQSESVLKQLERIGIDVYYTDDQGVERARNAMQIFKDIADKYGMLSDRDRRNLDMALFGTYQGAKGQATLNALFEAVKISDTIAAAQADPNLTAFYEKLTANAMTPIMEIERAGSSVTMALTSVLEELSPEIVDIAKGIQNLASSIHEHREALAGFISFLGNSVLGLATYYGIRRIGTAAGVGAAIDRVKTMDNLFGNPGVLGKGSTQGVLQNFAGLTNPLAIANNNTNREFIKRALSNETIAPAIKSLAEMTDAQVRTMQAYIRDNNIRVKDMKDLILVAQEAQGYTPKRQLTDDERWGGSQRTASKLYDTGMQGIDENFTRQLADMLRDREKFDELGKTKQGRKVTDFLAGLDENELKRFQAHVEELHRSTGKVVNDMGSLTHAINTYTGALAKNREELRRTNPQLVSLSNSMDKVVSSMNSPGFLTGLKNFDTFIGGIGQKARGAISALGGLARTIGGMGAQMLLFAGIGEFASSLSSHGLYTKEQKEIARLQKQIQDINEFKNWTQQGGFSAGLQEIWRSAVGLWDGITSPTKDEYTDLDELFQVGLDFTKFLNERYKANLPMDATPLAMRDNIQNYLRKINADVDKIFDEFMNWGDESVQKNLKEAQMAEYRKSYEKLTFDEQERKSLQDQLNRKVQERMRKDLEEGSFRIYDLDTVKQDLADRIKDINASYHVEQLKLLSDGYASDSERFIESRRRQSEEIIKLYNDELNLIDAFISKLRQNIEKMRREGASAEDIQKEEDLLKQWEGYKEDAEKEFRAAALEEQQAMQQREFEAAMSRISRAASINESMRARQDAINSATMDRNSREYINASIGISRSRIADLNTQIEQLRSAAVTGDQMQEVEQQIAQLQAQIAQERVRIRELQLSGIGLYRQGLNDRLAEMSNEYLQARVDAGMVDEDSPFLRNLRIQQYEKQVDMFNSIIEDLRRQLSGTSDPEAITNIQREIRDLQRQSLQAQLGILQEMKNTGGTFNLPDNVRAMSYYEYVTRNNTHTTYTVQGGDTHITVTFPNITDGTSLERVRQIGKAFGEGLHEGKNLRLQKQANPFGYRG